MKAKPKLQWKESLQTERRCEKWSVQPVDGFELVMSKMGPGEIVFFMQEKMKE